MDGWTPDVLVSLDPATAEMLFKTSEGKRDLAPGDGTRSTSRAAEAPQEPRIDSASASADVEAAPERPVSAGGAPSSDRGDTAGPRSGTSPPSATHDKDDIDAVGATHDASDAFALEAEMLPVAAEHHPDRRIITSGAVLHRAITAARAEVRAELLASVDDSGRRVVTWSRSPNHAEATICVYGVPLGRISVEKIDEIRDCAERTIRFVIERVRKEARAAALEACAQLCNYIDVGEQHHNGYARGDGAAYCARRIRALASEAKP